MRSLLLLLAALSALGSSMEVQVCHRRAGLACVNEHGGYGIGVSGCGIRNGIQGTGAGSTGSRPSNTASGVPQNFSLTIDAARFASTHKIEDLVNQVCEGGLRLPGSPGHLKTVDYIRRQLRQIPGLQLSETNFTLANWQPKKNSMYESAQLKVDGKKVEVVGSIAYSLPTNDSALSGPLLYIPASANIADYNITGKVVLRDYPFLDIPTSLFSNAAYYYSPDSINHKSTYIRPFVSPPNADLLACSLQGAIGYISAFNVSRKQLEGYYSGHAGTHWKVPGVFTGAEQYQTLLQAAAQSLTASISIDAINGSVVVPRIHATLPGVSKETIVVATHTDGVTYVQENGPVALLTLAQYFASLPLAARNKTIMFAFEASHLAYQLDSDKTLAKTLDATYDNGTTAFVIAVEHLGTREIEQYPNANGTGTYLNYTGLPESILWSVGEVQPAIAAVVGVAKSRALENTVVSPGFPPINPSNMVPTYASMGGLGTYYTNALVPTMALISGPWSLWAPSFGAEALDFERLRTEYLAIGDVILALSRYSKVELAGNYTTFRQRRASGNATVLDIDYVDAQFITVANATYY
ncbi:hypothetical protein D6C78_10858 [Aureobasidium pullulans]|uniref:Peptide hydrolase n=1 Tax=Aureobasidium pullulans TaxID=5580 RepID=A0A4T0B396_AURPU|nr:hypothetical protein D6C78_10858 [Aureobasidium pullulans]